MKVLYLSPFIAFGGATRSLVEVMRAMPSDIVDKHAIVAKGVVEKAWYPKDTTLTEVSGLMQWDNTWFSHYRGHRWLVLLRELASWRTSRKVLLQVQEAGPFDIIHCNEITLLPTAIMAKKILGASLVVHVRSLQAGPLTPRRTKWITKALARHADAIITIDEAVQRTLDPDLQTDIIYNSMPIPDERATISDDRKPLTFGIIGSLSTSKAVLETVEACIELKRRQVPFRLLIAGENVRKLKGVKGFILKSFNLARDIELEVQEMVNTHHMEDNVQMLGFVSDIGSVYDQLDVLCFPSHLDAPGRPVFEAALMGVPSIVAMRNPTKDVIENGVTGFVIDHPDPILIATAMEAFHDNRSRMKKMGRAARMAAISRFDSSCAAAKIIKVYNRALHRSETHF